MRAKRMAMMAMAWAGLLALGEAGAAGEPMRGLRERVVELAAEDGSALQTTLFSPPGEGPFPLVIISHGKAKGDPKGRPRDRFAALSREFVARGYAVAIPMRRGFAGSGGRLEESGCDTEKSARRQASDIASALRGLSGASWVKADAVVLAGQSYGGLASVGAGALGLPGVRGVINFAGGLRSDGCPWRSEVARAFEGFGRSAAPSLWLYGANDSLFDPQTARRWLAAHNRGGGSAELFAYGAFKGDAHGLAGSVEGARVWEAPVNRFLAKLGLPWQKTGGLPSAYGEGEPLAGPEEFAAGSAARAGYEIFLQKPQPRAFAVSKNGAWSWASDGDDPAGRALRACEKSAGQACELSALDGFRVRRPLGADSTGPALASASAR